MNLLKIAITGKMGSGKSSVTKIIKDILQDNVYVTSFSKPIRSTINTLDLIPNRELMQATGDFFRKFNQDVWTNLLLKEIEFISKTIVIEGIRYEFEAEKLRSNGFMIVKIDSRDETRKKRIEKREGIQIDGELWDEWQEHGTEKHVDLINADLILVNNDSLEPLRNKILSWLKGLRLEA